MHSQRSPLVRQALALTFAGEHRQLKTRVKDLMQVPVEQRVKIDAQSHEGTGVHDRGLLLIGIFKLAKSLFFFCIGIGAIHLLHKDLSDEVMRLATALRFDP